MNLQTLKSGGQMTANSKELILSVKNLTKKYNRFTALNNLSVEVFRGEIYGFLGPNGAGKTTTIECILGLKKVDSGKINLLDNPKREELFQRVGVQFQSTQFHNKIKVGESCELMSSLYHHPADCEQLIREFGLDGKKNNYVAQLSGGERQKLSIVLALINQPEIVFLDELTTGLDPEARRIVWETLKQLKKRGLTIFLTSHYMDEVTKLCDRITIIKQGEELITGTVDSVIQESGADNLEDAYLQFIQQEVIV
jgi:ABC-2 type transport system ATP-binding protein